MGKLYSLISALLLTVSATYAAVPDSYEWWFDHDVSSVQTGTISGGKVDLQIDTSVLPKGIHYFNLRLTEGDSIYGPVYRKLFHALGEDKGAISYEYWYDNDYDTKTIGSLNVGSNHLDLNISSLPQGAHYFNIRVGYGDGNWGAVYRKMVLNLAGNVNAIAYEYWLDNNYEAKTSGSLSPGTNTYEIDLKGLKKGLHRFNYRMQTGEGVWGAVFTNYFYCETNAARFTDYEYWLDNDFANRVSGKATGNPVSFEVDLSNFDKSGGAHYFNLRTRDGDSDWSPIYHKLLVFNNIEKRQPIIGYRHFLNGSDLGYVELERQFVDSYMFDVNLPDSVYPSVRNRGVSFDGDRIFIAGADSIDYTMQIRTELGWAPTQTWKIGVSNDFSATAVAMEINSKRTFTIPKALEFAAMKFTATGDSLYFRCDVPVALDIYKDGERVATLNTEQVKGMAMLKLEAGDYFGVLHSVEDSEAENFTLHLMDTPNQVPMPVITYEEGVVTMTCARQDAQIRYTLDGTLPTADGTIYTEPFTLTRNATVKAKAFVPGSDIEPSETAELIVDAFKVETPTGSFDADTRLLTITCATENATISYTFDPEGEWIPYSAPIAVDGNGTVYAMASLDGWNDSGIAEIVISDVKCAGVTFSYNGRYMQLSTTEPEASIRYTTDGSEPSAGMEYSGEFAVAGLCTVRAVTVKSGYMNSDTVAFIVDRYADEEHAETAAEGLLASAFDWDQTNLPNSLEAFRVEGKLNDADYEFIRSMYALRHLDIEKVADAHLPEYAFLDSRLISISMPTDLTECGDSIFSNATHLSSVIWNSTSKNVEEGVTSSLANPNVLLYVPSGVTVTKYRDINEVRDGDASEITLRYGFPYYAVRDFRADVVALTHDFKETTKVDTCRGWETIVLPFSPTEITHEFNGAAVPFAAWNGNLGGDKPFWLYRATSGGWEESRSIEACVPYIISMPNNPDYVKEFNLGGKVTFTAYNADLGPETSVPAADDWTERTEFEGTFMPVEEEGLLSLNVGSTEGGLQPGSTFVVDGQSMPFGAYVRGAAGRRAMPLFGDGSSVGLSTVVDNGLLIETPAPGMLRISSGRERKVSVTTTTGVTVRALHLKAGESVTLEGLTRDLYIVAGRKVMVR